MTRELVQRMGGQTAPVVIGSDILSSVGERIRALRGGKSPSSLLIVCDSAVSETWAAAVARSLTNDSGSGVRVVHSIIHATESNKVAATWMRVMDDALQGGVDRHGMIIAVGGGIVTDIAGFCAATYLRGIAWVAVPTTLLGMVDAALGGKTGINLALKDAGLGKNLAGSFWPPAAVIADTLALTSLPARVFRAGLAECLKHSMLADASIAPLLAPAIANYASSDAVAQWQLVDLIARSASVKLAIVAADPHEADQRMLLNLGHTFAHAIESQFCDELMHGEAVALGLVAASAASAASGRMTTAEALAVTAAVAGLGFAVSLPRPTTIESLENAAVFDKKRIGGALTLILPKSGGGADIVVRADPQLFRTGLRAIGAS